QSRPYLPIRTLPASLHRLVLTTRNLGGITGRGADERTGHLAGPRLRDRPDRARLPARPVHGAGVREPARAAVPRWDRVRLLPVRAHGRAEGAELEELRAHRSDLQRPLLRGRLPD